MQKDRKTEAGAFPEEGKRYLVAMRRGETPVEQKFQSIPNTMVKPPAADGTMLETAWESRWLPDVLKKRNKKQK